METEEKVLNDEYELKSDHFGIEMWEVGLQAIWYLMLKSDHFGIEII